MSPCLSTNPTSRRISYRNLECSYMGPITLNIIFVWRVNVLLKSYFFQMWIIPVREERVFEVLFNYVCQPRKIEETTRPETDFYLFGRGDVFETTSGRSPISLSSVPESTKLRSDSLFRSEFQRLHFFSLPNSPVDCGSKSSLWLINVYWNLCKTLGNTNEGCRKESIESCTGSRLKDCDTRNLMVGVLVDPHKQQFTSKDPGCRSGWFAFTGVYLGPFGSIRKFQTYEFYTVCDPPENFI